jgi:hypothetical protein
MALVNTYVGVGPPEVTSPLDAQLLHGFPLLRLLRVVPVGDLILHFSDEAQLGVDVEVCAVAE